MLLFIFLRFIIILINFVSNPKLAKDKEVYDDLISILIPARDEENNIVRLLESISVQDYNNYEIIVLDDGSNDRTFEICSAFAIKHRRLKVIRGEPLPDSWIGKNFACHQLAKKAKGKYLLFLDADVLIQSGAINSALHRMKTRKLHLLSLFANQKTVTLGEKTVVPLMHYLLLSLLPVRLIYSGTNPAFGVASGQFMLFDADIYRANNWHAMARHHVVEDVAIMRMVKTTGLQGESLMANGFVNCRMYKNYTGAIEGFSKNFLTIFNDSIPLFAGYLIVVACGPLFIFMTLNIWLITTVISVVILGRIMIAFLSGQALLYDVILHPLQMINLTVIFFTIIYKRLTGTTQWKGRRISNIQEVSL